MLSHNNRVRDLDPRPYSKRSRCAEVFELLCGWIVNSVLNPGLPSTERQFHLEFRMKQLSIPRLIYGQIKPDSRHKTRRSDLLLPSTQPEFLNLSS